MTDAPIIGKLLVANRAEIAVRIIRTASRLGIPTVAVYSEADADLPHVALADESYLIGPAAPSESYLDIDRILAVAVESGATAVHPGYGFLSESPAFARRLRDAGLIWVGPTPESMEQVADKINARNLMQDAGVPTALGTREPVASFAEALEAAAGISYPLMVKPSGGGGGIGMVIVHSDDELETAFDSARSRAERFFGDSRILLERYIASARHVEVQILGLADGRVIALGERDCSVQRRHQKVAEESPSPGVDPALRARMLASAVRAGEAVGYRNAGTVECLLDTETLEFVFLEMNARLQVEHPITEEVHGIDLVEAQLRIAAGLPVQFDPDEVETRGHALELRIYAEDSKRFLPGPGLISEWTVPHGVGVRLDAGYAAGNRVSVNYDPLMAKLVVTAPTRVEAIERAKAAVADFTIVGPKSNLAFFAELLENDEFVGGRYDTGLVSRMRP
ncbi:acetyl-CoA carboxylase, biotin carboxylase subunit [Agreia bicolorata]|uniref:biotin carboxylase n=1 Tax=Agreia bicolorata TaxID=110935 RepID=A0A1T4WQL9_9MICO|nr:biotin carboxylase N-terminal domain-containing protein [Agreia bicolorata]SKA79407.1 acetyl-CoA carboxylase, biotin carboxylase subunit [Agreia bicolorata]